MSDDFKNPDVSGENEPSPRKRPSVSSEDESFASDIPVPSDEEPTEKKPHKIVRVVEVAPQKKEYNDDPGWDDDKKKKKEKKGGFIGEFFAGAAAGAKTVGKNISAGFDTVTGAGKKGDEPKAAPAAEEEPKAEPQPQPEADVKTEPKAEPAVSQKPKADEKASPKSDKKPSDFLGGIMQKLNSLPTGAVIGGAATLIVVLVALILIIATSCGSSKTPVSNSSTSSSKVQISSAGDTSEEEDGPEVLVVPSRLDKIADAFNINNDVVGWLYIPGLSDVDAGVCQDTKSYSYNKRDVTGKKVNATYWINGAYYTHLRNTFGEGVESLSTNTVIFGHSDLGITNLAYTNDDPNGPLFSQLFSFKDPNFAEQTPYIYFSTADHDYVWEVFAVFYNDSKIDGGKALWYIEPEPGTKYQTLIDTVRERSLYDYDVEVTTDDKILTLSTCTVGYGLGNRERYRFVIVAKLVEDEEALVVRNASFTINADAPIPDTYAEEFNGYAENWKPSEEVKAVNPGASEESSVSSSASSSSAASSSGN